VQDHLLLAARAHVDRVVFDHFLEAIEACGDEETKTLLNRVCDLYIMSLLERERGWFLEHGQLSPARAKAVITNVNRLCRELRPEAELLVDAFGIPDVLLPDLIRRPMAHTASGAAANRSSDREARLSPDSSSR
jgi:acyl-CoA oxidase